MVTIRQRNHLRHLDEPQGTYLVTYCLADAFPPGFLSRLYQARDAALEKLSERFGRVSTADVRQIQKQLRRELFEEMDKGHGRCEMHDSEIARIVANSLEHFHTQRYRLIAYAVMPNHVHVILDTFAGWSWWKVIGASKSYTAKQANRVLERSGTFWQDDNWETLILSDPHLENAIDYVLANPSSARLKDWRWVKDLRVTAAAGRRCASGETPDPQK